MEYNVKIKKQNNRASLELEKFSREELITRIRTLEAHNVQLQNIITKTNNSTTKNAYCNNFNFSKCRFRHILLHVCYLGWDYKGFSVQEDTSNTIEYHLFHALIKTCLIQERSSSNYHRCGRTDKGVSSFGQVISIDVRSKLNAENKHELAKEIDYCKLLNRVLPGNIRCIAWAPIESNFSARFNCASRTYKYYFPKGKLNIEKMEAASKSLIGSHDFRNFAKMDVGNGVVQFVRNLLDFRIEPINKNSELNEYSVYVAIIKGNAFLWHQIRYIMGLLFLIGSNKEDPEIVKELLDVHENPRRPEYSMASEVPLNLFTCEYEDVHWHVKEENLQSVVETIQGMCTVKTIQAVMLKDIMDNLSGQLEDSQKLELKCPSASLVEGVKRKLYIPVMKRQKCESLEDKIKHYSKRKRIEIVSNINGEINK